MFLKPLVWVTNFSFIFAVLGGLAQLARALAWHARGRRFDPDTLHNNIGSVSQIVPRGFGKVVGSTPILSTKKLAQ